MGHALELKTRYSLADYLQNEEQSPFRSEYFRGELFAMAGTSDVHNKIAQNLTFSLRLATRGGPCDLFIENLKLELQANEHYVYPDVMLTCDARDRADRYVKRHPRILAEVLSSGTEAHDRFFKLPRYLQLPSLEAMLLVGQTGLQVELYLRKGEEWVFSVFTSPEEEVVIGEIRFLVKELYEGIQWEAPSEGISEPE